MSDQQYQDTQEAQANDEALAWVDGRIFRKVDESGRMEVVIIDIDSKKVSDHFFVEPDEVGNDTYFSLSPLRSFAGERISERDLKEKHGFQRGKNVRFNYLTRAMELSR